MGLRRLKQLIVVSLGFTTGTEGHYSSWPTHVHTSALLGSFSWRFAWVGGWDSFPKQSTGTLHVALAGFPPSPRIASVRRAPFRKLPSINPLVLPQEFQRSHTLEIYRENKPHLIEIKVWLRRWSAQCQINEGLLFLGNLRLLGASHSHPKKCSLACGPEWKSYSPILINGVCECKCVHTCGCIYVCL